MKQFPCTPSAAFGIRVLPQLAAIAMTLAVAACGGSDSPRASNSPSTAQQLDVRETTAAYRGEVSASRPKSTEEFTSRVYENYLLLKATVDYNLGTVTGKVRDSAGWDGCWRFRVATYVNGQLLNTRVIETHVPSDDVYCVGTFTIAGDGLDMPQNSPWAGNWSFVVEKDNSRANPVAVYTLDFNVKACRSEKNPALPVYHARQLVAGAMDSMYTTDLNSYNDAIRRGYQANGPEFRVESQPGWNRTLGNTSEYHRYWFAPWTDSINVSNQSDISTVNWVGFMYARSEGYIYDKPVPNTVALYRLWINWGADDVEHLTTVHKAFVDDLLLMGWHSDGIVGYVCMP